MAGAIKDACSTKPDLAPEWTSFLWNSYRVHPAPASNQALLKGSVKENDPNKLQSPSKFHSQDLSRKIFQTRSRLQTSFLWRIQKGKNSKPAPASNELFLRWPVMENRETASSSIQVFLEGFVAEDASNQLQPPIKLPFQLECKCWLTMTNEPWTRLAVNLCVY